MEDCKDLDRIKADTVGKMRIRNFINPVVRLFYTVNN